MRFSTVAIAFLSLVPLMSGCTGPSSSNAPAVNADALEPRVTLHTTKGDIVIALYEQQVPLVAANFVHLVKSGFYNGTKFTRIVPGFDIQAGDAASRAGDPAKLPPGPAAKLWDEFHPALRHDRAGLVSMVNYGPDTGATEFFITTAPAPFYDDRYGLFGHVVAGMDAVNAIAAIPISGNGTYGAPTQSVTITGATFVRQAVPPGALQYGVQVRTLAADKTTEAGRNATFAVIVTNMGNVRDVYNLTVQVPAGWTAQFENNRVLLPAGRGWVMLLDVASPSTASTPRTITVTARSQTQPSASATTTMTLRFGPLGATPHTGDHLKVEYTGTLEDGRIFDTTDSNLGNDAGHAKMSTTFRRATYAPYDFTVGGGVVQGFDQLVLRTKVGETTVGRVAAAAGYVDASPGNELLYQRPLVFEVRILPG